MPEMRTYGGGCHCGRVRYEVATSLEPVIDCNCSICQKRGALLDLSSSPPSSSCCRAETT